MPGNLGQGRSLGVRIAYGRGGQPVQHGLDRLKIRGRLAVHHEFGIVGEAKKERPFQRAAQPST